MIYSVSVLMPSPVRAARRVVAQCGTLYGFMKLGEGAALFKVRGLGQGRGVGGGGARGG
jgi:hypothetical protein